MARSLLFGGILPVIAFTVIEESYGTIAGIIAGMIFGVGEIFWEWKTRGKVDPFTWGGNAMILVLGGISLIANEGVWFKLQPAIMEAVMAVVLWGSLFMKTPLLVGLAEKQGQTIPPVLRNRFNGFTFRLGVFFALHGVLATWAALRWSTQSWAILKGVGFTMSCLVYFFAEGVVLRFRLRQKKTMTVETRFSSD